MTCNGSIQPLELPIKNVSLPAIGPNAFTRGIPVAIGTPMQQFSALPHLSSNHTTMVDVKFFEALGVHSGQAAGMGGLYKYNESSTAVLTSLSAWSDLDHDLSSFFYGDDVPGLLLEDTIYFGENSSLAGFPLFDIKGSVAQQAHAILGLSTYSSFLNRLAAVGMVSSLVWSIWTGSQSLNDPVDGLLMIGGYDEARIGGDLLDFASNLGCGLPLNITAISYEADGQITTLLDPSQGHDNLQVCMESWYPRLDLPQDVFDKFATASHGNYNGHIDYVTYENPDIPAGNLVVTLSGGYSTIIPSSEIFTKLTLHDEEGQLILDNDFPETVALVHNSTASPLLFGQPFMTMNYIIVDYAHSMYQMALANRSKFSDSNRAGKPKAICRQEHAMTTVFDGTPSPTQSSSTAESAMLQLSVPLGPADGEIAGSIASVFLGAAMLALIGLVVLTKYHKRVKKAAMRRRETETMELLIGQGSEHSESDIPSGTKRKRAKTL